MLEQVTLGDLSLWTPVADTGVGRCLREHGEFAPFELELILRECDGDFVDVGANVGALALPFAKARADRQVIAVEANRHLAALLARNAAENGLGNVVVHPVVAGEARGRVSVPQDPLNYEGNLGALSLYGRQTHIEPRPMSPLDDLAPPSTRFVKIDVEGFEPRVLAGAERLLGEVRPTWLVETSSERPKASQRVIELLRGYGYRLHWFFSPHLRQEVLAGKARGDFAVYASDRPPSWDLPSADAPKPTRLEAFPYIAEYQRTASRVPPA